jgi:nicotinate phosphoribosyltransferase
MLKAGASVDAFGIGTSLGSGAGSVEHDIEGGSLGTVYKESCYVAEDGIEHPKIKIAGEKSTWPGRKEIYRHPEWKEDVIQLAHEPRPDNYHRLLKSVMRNGEIVPGSLPPLSEIRELAQYNLSQLPEHYRQLIIDSPYPVRFSAEAQLLRQQAANQIDRINAIQ